MQFKNFHQDNVIVSGKVNYLCHIFYLTPKHIHNWPLQKSAMIVKNIINKCSKTQFHLKISTNVFSSITIIFQKCSFNKSLATFIRCLNYATENRPTPK